MEIIIDYSSSNLLSVLPDAGFIISALPVLYPAADGCLLRSLELRCLRMKYGQPHPNSMTGPWSNSSPIVSFVSKIELEGI
jgi:hypothetical protein